MNPSSVTAQSPSLLLSSPLGPLGLYEDSVSIVPNSWSLIHHQLLLRQPEKQGLFIDCQDTPAEHSAWPFLLIRVAGSLESFLLNTA